MIKPHGSIPSVCFDTCIRSLRIEAHPGVKKFWIVGVVIVAMCVLGTFVWVGSGHARIPLILVPVVMLNRALNPEQVAAVGGAVGEDNQASARPVSERFGTTELQKMFDVLNSEAFQ